MSSEIKWRVIDPRTGQPSGVAPVCPRPDVHAMMHGGPPTDTAVYDECCAGPHIECWYPAVARAVVKELNEAGAEVCS